MFKPGKIIRKIKARNGEEIILRYPKMSDVDGILKMVNEMIAEGKITRDRKMRRVDELKWLKELLSKIRKKISVSIVAESCGKIIGLSEITAENSRLMEHVGEFNIIIKKDFRGVGIGTVMTKTITSEARKTKIEIIRLHVNSENKSAFKLYQKAGFRIVGKIPKEIKKNGKYLDNIIMIKNL